MEIFDKRNLIRFFTLSDYKMDMFKWVDECQEKFIGFLSYNYIHSKILYIYFKDFFCSRFLGKKYVAS